MMQVLVNSLITASIYAMGAIGLTLVFAIMKFANCAHGSYVTLGAYLAYLFGISLGLNFGISVLFAAALVGSTAILCEELVFKKVRPFGGLTLLVSSLALVFVFDNLVMLIWGPEPKNYGFLLAGLLTFWGARITYCQVLIIIISLVAMFLFHLLLTKTKLGKAMRAISDNPNLASSCGINLKTIIIWTWFISGAYATIGGVMMAIDTQIWPRMGFETLLPLFAAVIVGGIGNPYGAMLGALLIGFAQNIGLGVNWGRIFTLGTIDFYISPPYKSAISFVAIIITLIFRPQGILKGRKGD